MSAPPSAHSASLRKPYRPLPIALLNRVAPVTPLSAQSLIVKAKRQTGLSDFGDDAFRDPLERLVCAINEEASLTAMGSMIIRGRLTSVLSNKLRVEAAIKAHPEILERPIERPIIIAGLQRTGTTMLHRLIARDPGIRSLASWEALNAAATKKRPWQRQDPRVRQAIMAEKGLAYIAPEFFAIHPVEAHAPEEEVILLDYAFLSTSAEATLHVPSYAAWLEEQDQTPAYEGLKRILQYLQWERPGERWVLKTPHHLEWLDTVLDVFPDATIVQTHRDPLKTLASFCSMVTHARGIFSDEVDPEEVARHWFRKVVRMVTRASETRDRVGGDRFVDVSYYDLVRDPIIEVQRIYERAGRELTAEAIQAMQASRKVNRQHKYGRHRYRLEDFGLTREQVEPELATYRERFAIRHE